ncbi:hypothetical protein RE9425_23870 [Prescottella equi]|nr:hypothetical protein RE9425_23870 [Prescottella equi]
MAATAMHMTGSTTQNQGNPGARPSRPRRGNTVTATSTTTPIATSTNHAMRCTLRSVGGDPEPIAVASDPQSSTLRDSPGRRPSRMEPSHMEKGMLSTE